MSAVISPASHRHKLAITAKTPDNGGICAHEQCLHILTRSEVNKPEARSIMVAPRCYLDKRDSARAIVFVARYIVSVSGGVMTEQDMALFEALMPYAARETRRVRENDVRFVHYTTAETAIKILRGGELWLRNSTVMNDFSEVKHGMACLRAAWQSAQGARLKDIMATVQADLPEIFEANFDAQINDVHSETYLFSISEHAGGLEDQYGRLSMWRAYAPRNGVAFVFKNTPFINESNALNAFSSPVNYATVEKFEGDFKAVVDGFDVNLDIIKDLGGAWLNETLIRAFRIAVQSTKHPSFDEEREWRVLYTPSLLNRERQLTPQQLERIPTEIVTLGGVPQRIFKIPFKNYPDEGFVGASIPELVDRVLIGPTIDSYMIAQAIIGELMVAGVQNADQKVVITGIPLRD